MGAHSQGPRLPPVSLAQLKAPDARPPQARAQALAQALVLLLACRSKPAGRYCALQGRSTVQPRCSTVQVAGQGAGQGSPMLRERSEGGASGQAQVQASVWQLLWAEQLARAAALLSTGVRAKALQHSCSVSLFRSRGLVWQGLGCRSSGAGPA